MTCNGEKCKVCSDLHNTLLHNARRLPGATVDLRGDSSTFNQSSAIATEASKHHTRSLLPVVKMQLRNRHYEYTAIGLLDSGSEIHIMSSKCCNHLQLVRVPFIVNIVGVGGVVVQKKTKKVEVCVKDVWG